jgi:ligand-binding sensor domain-containing protein
MSTTCVGSGVARGLGRRTVLACILLSTAALPAAAERLPVHNYTSSDGLVQDGAILQIMQDSLGFLWFVASSGISRFDGQSFRNFVPPTDSPTSSAPY